MEGALYEVLDKLKTELVPAEELQKVKNQAKANGVVTPLERARIHAAQNIQSGRIFLKQHN